jgi:predicted transport protein
MLYNLIFRFDISIPVRYIHLLALNKVELNKFIIAYANGEEAYFWGGKSISIKDILEIRIFDCSHLIRNKNIITTDEINLFYSNELEKYRGMFSDKYKLVILAKIGRDITNQYIKGEFGYRKKLIRKRRKPSPSFQLPDITPITHNKYTMPSKKPSKIFISHSSKDKEIVNLFCENILHYSLKIDTTKQLFNTSLDGSKPVSGEDFRNRIKDELTEASHVLQFISTNYKSSEVCLNEMGAAWVLNSKVIPLIVDQGGYDVGFLNSTKQQVKLNDENAILHLIEELAQDLKLEKSHIAQITGKVRAFIKLVNDTYPSQNLKKTSKRSSKSIAPSSKPKSTKAPQKTQSAYTESYHLKAATVESKKLYREYKPLLLSLDKQIKISAKKHYLSFKYNGKTIADMAFRENTLRIWVNLAKGELSDPKGKAQDVSEKGHLGSGDYRLVIDAATDTAYIRNLLKQALKKYK